MNLRIYLPAQVYLVRDHVVRIVVETPGGSFGILPNRLDCVATIRPSVLVYETEDEGETYVAVDHGGLVKVGPDVRISVRRAVSGSSLATLRDEVMRTYRVLDSQERSVQDVMLKLETAILRRLVNLAS